MFARHVTLQLKPNFSGEFPTVMEKEVIPLLKKQKGFLEELLLITPATKEAVAISLWEEKEHAETYNRTVYPEVIRILNKYTEGPPSVKTFDVEHASFRKFATV
jgi:quinol monooxygenase YgiN